jgi:hypothetical protein
MGLTDADASAAPDVANRSRQVAAALEQTDFLQQLRKTHDVHVFRFDEGLKPLVNLSKTAAQPEGDAGPSPEGGAEGGQAAAPDSQPDAAAGKIDWEKELKPAGRETRLGQSIRQAINEQRSAPLAGIVVVTDGGQNAGPPPETAIELAREAKVPVFPVGVGSAKRPVNVRVYELEAPERAHPGDPYSVTGLIQAEGLAGQSVTVQLFLKEPGKQGAEQLVQSQQAILGGDGDGVPVKFQLTPAEVGRKVLSLRVLAPRSDRNPDDNHREADIEIIDRKTKVLLFAGGPTREYQFLRSLLFRDKTTTLDLFLQSGKNGISQDAAKILDSFPDTREAMFAYDCVVAFDPQWQALSLNQVDLLESWVGEQGGGLVVVAGPVYAGQAINGWIQDANMAKVRALYPVDFPRRFTILDRDSFTAKEPWPLEFSREGREAEFLWLADDDGDSQRAWTGFAGVYGYQPVRGAKAGATVYARFNDPKFGQSDQQPIYFAGQFYGSGRVFYMGSGEMWRLRRHDETYFEQFYTRLLRHVSQGRLLRQSSRGMLMVDKDRYILGNTAMIRAQLTNIQLQPLVAASVTVEVFQPDASVQTISLRPDPSRAGMYAGQMTLLQEGMFRLELPIPESDSERLTRRIQVRLPDLERENPQRNDPLLTRVAAGTGGKYYDKLETALASTSSDPVAGQLKDRTKTSILTAAPNPLFEDFWRRWMMFGLCGVLCVEWLIRRLAKLA